MLLLQLRALHDNRNCATVTVCRGKYGLAGLLSKLHGSYVPCAHTNATVLLQALLAIILREPERCCESLLSCDPHARTHAREQCGLPVETLRVRRQLSFGMGMGLTTIAEAHVRCLLRTLFAQVSQIVAQICGDHRLSRQNQRAEHQHELGFPLTPALRSALESDGTACNAWHAVTWRNTRILNMMRCYTSRRMHAELWRTRIQSAKAITLGS